MGYPMNDKAIRGGGLMKVLFAILVSVLCCAVMAADLTNSEKKVVADSIRKELTDPDSAKFKWVPLVGKTTNAGGSASATYCGLVNSKNRMGGYAGDAPFIVFLMWVNNKFLSAVVRVGSANWESTESKSIVETCMSSGYDRLDLAE